MGEADATRRFIVSKPPRKTDFRQQIHLRTLRCGWMSPLIRVMNWIESLDSGGRSRRKCIYEEGKSED